MRIDLVEHSDLVRGVVEVEETPEGVRPRRMTEEAIEFYREPDRFYRRAQYCNGIRIAFVTDSAFVSMRLIQGVVETPHAYQVDVLIDRSECHTYGPDEAEHEFTFTIDLPRSEDGDHEVEILLPLTTEVLIGDLELADGALFRPIYCSDERLIFLGDSITAGAAATSPMRSYAAQLAANLGTDYINWSVGGARLQSELARMAMELEWQKAIVAYGVNDFGFNGSAPETGAEMTRFLKHLTRRPGVSISVITPLYWPERENKPNEQGFTLEDFRREIAAAAGAFRGVHVIDGRKLVAKDRKFFVEDGVHPNNKGMAVIAENLYNQINKSR